MLRNLFRNIAAALRAMVLLVRRVSRAIMYARDWMMHSGARTIEVGNVLGLLGWGLSYAVQKQLGLDIGVYKIFQGFDGYFWYWGMIILALVHLVLILVNSIRCNVLSGFLLLISSGVWTFVAIMLATIHPAHTGVTTYALAAVACISAGSYMMSRYDCKVRLHSTQCYLNIHCAQQTGRENNVRTASNRDTVPADTSSPIRHAGGSARRVVVGKDGSRWVPVKRYIHRLWYRLRSGGK